MKNKKVRRNRTFEKGTHKKEERKKLQEREQFGEEKAQSNNGGGKRKSEEEREEKGSLKTKHKKTKKLVGNPKSHISGALTPLAITCHVAMMCTALPQRINAQPLCIKYGTKPQESCLGRKPFTF